MSLRQKYRLAFQLAWAVSILWIYVGSLVNFHQHHLWRRQLIPQVVSSVNKNEKSKAAARFHKKDQDNSNNGNDFSPVLLQQGCKPLNLKTVSIILLARGNSPDIREISSLSPGLRAPPVL